MVDMPDLRAQFKEGKHAGLSIARVFAAQELAKLDRFSALQAGAAGALAYQIKLLDAEIKTTESGEN